MTEDEAKTKWCPFTRMCVTGPDNDHMAGFNRIQTSNDSPREFAAAVGGFVCIGSECMAWRWSEPWDTAKVRKLHKTGMVGSEQDVTNVREGHCGLAGRP